MFLEPVRKVIHVIWKGAHISCWHIKQVSIIPRVIGHAPSRFGRVADQRKLPMRRKSFELRRNQCSACARTNNCNMNWCAHGLAISVGHNFIACICPCLNARFECVNIFESFLFKDRNGYGGAVAALAMDHKRLVIMQQAARHIG